MINHPNSNKRLSLKQYVPIYMKSEEIDTFFDMFEDALNNMYDAADNSYSYDIVTKTKAISDVAIEEDTAPNLFKYPYNTIDPDNVDSVIINPDGTPSWEFDNTKPSPSNLNPVPNNGGLNPPPPYPLDTPNDGYLNTAPPQSYQVPIKYPDPDGGPFTMVQGFDNREPINVQSRSSNEANQRSAQSDYQKHGLYDIDNIFKGEPRPVPKYTAYTERSQVNLTKEDHLSVLEKIYRVIDLKDASMIDMKYLQFFADYLGYDLNLNLDDFGTNIVNKRYGQYYSEIEKEENIEKQVRTMIENLPNWYKIKTTENALKIILYSFGLVADILTYYTGTYSTNRQDWETADKKLVRRSYKSWSDDSLVSLEDFTGSKIEGRPEIPDEWYPTPHFEVRYSINNSFDWETGSLFYDETTFAMLAKSIDAAKPINTVFEGLAALFQTRNKRMITAYTLVSDVRFHNAIATDCEFDSSGNVTSCVLLPLATNRNP